MNPINFDFLKAIVLPALIYSSVMSLLVAVVIIGTIASAIERKKGRFSGGETTPTAIETIPNPILFPIYGSFIGLMLLTFLPIQADRDFRNNGMYVGIWLVQKLIVLVPLGSILGATTGCIVGEQLNRKVNLRHMWIGLGITYSIMALTIYTSLVPLPIQMLKPVAKSGDFLPVIAEISGYEKASSRAW
jgi:sensor histidine kinase YesM